MRTDEELIAEHNVQIIASALLDTINAICKIENHGDNSVKGLMSDLLVKYGDQLQDIVDNGNSV